MNRVPAPPPLRLAGVHSISGAALLMTLLILSLMTIIVVVFLGTMTLETAAARTNYESQKARAVAMYGMNTAVGQIRAALDTWDDPYKNFATNPPAYFWSMSPGIITRWSYTNVAPLTNYPLFSIGSTNLVNLNAAASDGTYPIIGGASAPNISVYWANVLQNPAANASANNPIVGRYAFWVDDENAKININTADGTYKYTTNSLGIGTPSEVSLQALQQGGANLSTTVATNIVYLARTAGLNSPREILRAAGTAPDLYTNNVFNLTTSSRSPDLNIFGQPKMALMPILGTSANTSTDMVTNAITFQPVREIYPTPSQLPSYAVVNPVNWTVQAYQWYPTNSPAAVRVAWPLTFRGITGLMNSGNYGVGLAPNSAQNGYTQANYCWVNGYMLANYLAGTNAAGRAINWPAFPGTSTNGFAGKYSNRQIDSIVAQIVGLGAKEISPDRTSIDDARSDASLQRNMSNPPIFFGWLSHQWVIGMGRSPKVNAMEILISAYGDVPDASKISSCYVLMNIFQEWWMPANYLGGKNTMPVTVNYGGINLGVQGLNHYLNVEDLMANITPNLGTNADGITNYPNYYWPPAPLPKLRDSTGSTNSYWGNQLLTNNQGLDFQGIFTNRQDPDQELATTYHSFAATNGGKLMGVNYQPGQGGYSSSSPLGMYPIQGATPPQLQPSAPNGDWAPGELRMTASSFGNTTRLFMRKAAGGSTLTVQGGFQVRTAALNGWITDADPTPLESLRGQVGTGTPNMLFDCEAWTASATLNSYNSMPGSPPGTTVRDRNMASVIPFQISTPVPVPHMQADPDAYVGSPAYVLATVDDPLVNKFPGDWIVTTGSTTPSVPTYWGSIAGGGVTTRTYTVNSATEYSSGFHTTLNRGTSSSSVVPDPDSYWMPQADVPTCYLTNVPAQTLIPRSARFPNIGYLQYVRTGIIPDDESLPYNPVGLSRSQYQHGTPFRLLSYAPSTESASQETTKPGSAPYPDWALLDLLYVPSLLSPYRSPYGYYDIAGTWQGYGNAGVMAHFSTGGGSTPGRINPNGSVIYTTNVTTPLPNISRTLPLQAVLQGIMVNQTNVVSTSPTAGYSGGSAVPAATLSQAIYSYLSSNGPFRVSAELCNVPEIAALRPSINTTRNDLIRQILGALTTQSNTFSVWVDGQSISKAKANTGYDVYEPGDQITATVRYHFIVERYLDPGADGVYGSSTTAGPDGVVGNYDAPIDAANPANHPFLPRYLYRVVSSEEIR